MTKYPLPKNEVERLHDLLSYDILETESEPQFNDIVEMAAVIFEVPVALISLVGADSQWFKAKCGLDASELSRDISFCAHALCSPEVLLVPDTFEDPRFRENPMVTGDPHIRFYAGAPLVSARGNILGTLCIVDYRPRELTGEQIKILKKLSNQVISQLELRRALKKRNANLEQIKNLSSMLFEQDERLRYLEKLQSLREMSGGVSHEINNPLTSIMLGIDILRRNLSRTYSGLDYELATLSKMDNSAKKIENIVSSLKLYSSQENLGTDVLNFGDIIQETMFLCEERLKKDGIGLSVSGELKLEFQGKRPLMLQVLFQLISNSCEALEKLNERWIRIHVQSTEGHIQLRITDSGKGISEKIVRKMMEPFFTTKDIGKGPGLGLSMCRGILSESNGDIRYELHQGQTSFVVELPLIQEYAEVYS